MTACVVRFYILATLLLICGNGIFAFKAHAIRGIKAVTIRKSPSNFIHNIHKSTAGEGLTHAPDTSSQILPPSYREIFKFGLPTLGIWLLQPILGLIDSSFIGMSNNPSSVAQLAGIGPGIAWIDSTSYLFCFLGIATTNLYATALYNEADENKAQRILSHATLTSFGFGIFLSLVQYGFAPSVVTKLCGTCFESIPFSIEYCKIRSIASVFAIPQTIIQSAFIVRKQTLTPLIAVLLGSLINIFGDWLLVGVMKQGLNGAAWATLASQFVGFVYLLYSAFTEFRRNTPTSSTSQLLSKIREQIHVPKLTDISKILVFSGPLFIILFFKAFLWSYTTYAVATSGLGQLAAHQIMINIFLFFVIFGDVFSQVSQTYIPMFMGEKQPSKSDVDNTVTLMNRLTIMTSFVGVLNTCASLLYSKFGSKFITTNSDVLYHMQIAAPFLALSILPHSMMAAFEGALIAIREQKFHSISYIVSGSIFLAVMTKIRLEACGIRAIWCAMAVFQWARLALFSNRLKDSFKRKTTAANAAVAV